MCIHDQGNLQKTPSNWAYTFRGLKSTSTEQRHGGKEELRASTLTDKQEVEKATWDWHESFKTAKPTPMASSNNYTAPNPSQTILPTGNQALKYMTQSL